MDTRSWSKQPSTPITSYLRTATATPCSSASPGLTMRRSQLSRRIRILMVPDYLHKSENPGNEAWWICADGTRCLAETCACISCRLASGFDITVWAFIPTSNIFLDSSLDTPFPFDAYPPALATHTSSPGVTRSFCKRCGANVFWHGSEERTGRVGLVDVAVWGCWMRRVLRGRKGGWSGGEEGMHRGLGRGWKRWKGGSAAK